MNWSPLRLFNCGRCTALTADYGNSASGLELHRFHWLQGDHEIGAVPDAWNHPAAVQDPAKAAGSLPCCTGPMGGPWFRDQRPMGEGLAAEWFAARDNAFRLWD